VSVNKSHRKLFQLGRPRPEKIFALASMLEKPTLKPIGLFNAKAENAIKNV